MPNSQNMIEITPCNFDSGYKSFIVKVTPSFVQLCSEYDKSWDDDFRTNIGPTYPYTMSPKTSEMIAEVSTDLKQKMAVLGFQIDPWKISTADGPYVMGVLRRVMVPDTIEPIIGYTDELAEHLYNIRKDYSKIPSIRSYFCGAGVADKCLITRLLEKGVTANLIATDIAADSIAVALLNFSVWNDLLPENQKYEIHIVNGFIPEELYQRDRTIVLQVEDAVDASIREIDKNVTFDALLLDNGLTYVNKEFTSTLITNTMNNIGPFGMYIGALGLDSQIKVEISPLLHLKWIILSKFFDLPIHFAKLSNDEAPYPYPHKYHYLIDGKSQIIKISGVISDGAARTYNWLGNLLINNPGRFIQVMKAIKSATNLSKANKVVITTPFEYHNVIVNIINSHGFVSEVYEKPLEYERFGWEKMSEDLYRKNGIIIDGLKMLRLCKEQDPLVLRRSRILVKPKEIY